MNNTPISRHQTRTKVLIPPTVKESESYIKSRKKLKMSDST